jgi:hypothetical protein
MPNTFISANPRETDSGFTYTRHKKFTQTPANMRLYCHRNRRMILCSTKALVSTSGGAGFESRYWLFQLRAGLNYKREFVCHVALLPTRVT